MRNTQVYRVGTNWGGVDVFQYFKTLKIAFVGFEVENYVLSVKNSDILIITKGGAIIALADVVGLTDLSEVSENLAEEFDDVKCLKLGNIFLQEEYPSIDFGSYGGQGKQFHEAHGDYKVNAIKNFNKIKCIKMQQEIKALLKYKKQIILQGPPGTGKTRLAKEIATGLIAPTNLGSPLIKINEFLKQFDENNADVIRLRQQGQELLDRFFEKFPKEQLKELNLESYPLGTGTNDTFCWWLEYGLRIFGLYSGFAQKFLIVYKSDEDAYVRTGFTKNATTDQKGMALLANQIYQIVNESNLAEAKNNLGNGFILKLLNTYLPDKYFPVNSDKSLTNILKLLGVNPNGLDCIEKCRLLQEEFLKLKKANNSKASNVEFMRYLFSTFDLKGDIVLQHNELLSKGEMELIQFHPSYTYEDFVRGIVAKPNENGGGVLYKGENKTIAKFAKDAIDNPSGNYVLIIDEINRANLSSVLGELIYALEYRGDEVDSMYEVNGSNKITLPPNLYIIGTMNTADRSVGHIDYAIRRRFAFVDVLPEHLVSNDKLVFHDNLFKAVSEIFVKDFDPKIKYTSDNTVNNDLYLSNEFEAKDVWLGHSYFIQAIKKDEKGNQLLIPEDMASILEYEIKPILMEYVKDGVLKPSAIEKIKNLAI